MIHKIDFDQLGGYRLKQPTFKKMQETTFAVLDSLMKYFGLPETGNFIISGCNIIDGNITNGYLYIDGELCPFASAPGDGQTKIVKVISLETLAFKNGTNPAVFRKTSAAITEADGEATLSTFERVPPVREMIWANIQNIPASLVYDANYIHTDNNYTDEDYVKVESIEFGAQVNVQGDWNITNPALDSYIKNKPIIPIVLINGGETLIGDVGTGLIHDQLTPVLFQQNVGTTDYYVLFSLESTDNWDNDNDVFAVVRNKTAAGFELALHEVASTIQNLKIRYMIIKNPTP